MKRVMRVALMLLALMIGWSEATAQHTYKFKDSLGTYEVKFTPSDKTTMFENPISKPLLATSHELRLGIAWGCTTWRLSDIANWESLDYYGDPIERSYDTGNGIWFSTNLDYGYWVKEWLSIGASATWIAGRCGYYDSATRKRFMTIGKDYITIMPVARFAWYRRGIVQLYSSIGLGIGVERRERYWYGHENMWDVYCSFDIKPLGIAVGRKWFGFAEVGYGSRGVVNVGFGRRFNSKIR